MADYSNQIALAQRLLLQRGKAVDLLIMEATPADAAQPWKGAADPRGAPQETLTLNAVSVAPSGITSLGLSATDTDFVKRSDIIYIVAPGEAVDVRRFQLVRDGTTLYKIGSVEVLQPAEQVVLAYIGARR